MSFIKINNIISSKLKSEAFKSPISHKLAAVIIKNGKIIGTPHHNQLGSNIRGYKCASLHAETNTIINNFPDLRWSFKGWHLLRKNCKSKKIRRSKLSKGIKKG